LQPANTQLLHPVPSKASEIFFFVFFSPLLKSRCVCLFYRLLGSTNVTKQIFIVVSLFRVFDVDVEKVQQALARLNKTMMDNFTFVSIWT
jgi:hypothetical protein